MTDVNDYWKVVKCADYESFFTIELIFQFIHLFNCIIYKEMEINNYRGTSEETLFFLVLRVRVQSSGRWAELGQKQRLHVGRRACFRQ
jgi:hypothetical protein